MAPLELRLYDYLLHAMPKLITAKINGHVKDRVLISKSCSVLSMVLVSPDDVACKQVRNEM